MGHSAYDAGAQQRSDTSGEKDYLVTVHGNTQTHYTETGSDGELVTTVHDTNYETKIRVDADTMMKAYKDARKQFGVCPVEFLASITYD